MANLTVNFVYIIMAGAILASGVLFVVTKIRNNKESENEIEI
jgi:hypothetical protein